MLWVGNISALVGTLVTTVLYVSKHAVYGVLVSFWFSCTQMIHMCYWPHTLKPKEDQYYVYISPRSVDLFNVSTAVVD